MKKEEILCDACGEEIQLDTDYYTLYEHKKPLPAGSLLPVYLYPKDERRDFCDFACMIAFLKRKKMEDKYGVALMG
jgi:hypothetical protein